jgi:protein arginine kinase activator
MLICGHCNKQTALIHVAESVDREGKKSWDVQHLCEECAHELGLPHAKTLDSFFQALPLGLGLLTETKCSQCGMRFSDFRRTGRLGCEKCYDAFRDSLQEVLDKAHGGKTKHVGRGPGMSGEEATRREDLAVLQRKLRQAVEAEAYEEAARIRDRIRSIDPKAV